MGSLSPHIWHPERFRHVQDSSQAQEHDCLSLNDCVMEPGPSQHEFFPTKCPVWFGSWVRDFSQQAAIPFQELGCLAHTETNCWIPGSHNAWQPPPLCKNSCNRSWFRHSLSLSPRNSCICSQPVFENFGKFYLLPSPTAWTLNLITHCEESKNFYFIVQFCRSSILLNFNWALS